MNRNFKPWSIKVCLALLIFAIGNWQGLKHQFFFNSLKSFIFESVKRVFPL